MDSLVKCIDDLVGVTLREACDISSAGHMIVRSVADLVQVSRQSRVQAGDHPRFVDRSPLLSELGNQPVHTPVKACIVEA